MKLLVIGAGFGKEWMANARLTEHWEVGGIVTRTEESLAKVGRDFGIPEDERFTSLSRAIDRVPDIDAVAVATPNDTHLPLALEVLRAGKHLILEKPIVMNLGEARELFAEIAAHPGQKVMVGHTQRGNGVLRAISDAIKERMIGQVEMVNVQARNRWVGDPAERWRFALEDIMLDDIGIHQFDMLRMLLGERRCRTIFAEVFNPQWYPLPTRSTCSALLEMDDAVKVNYFSSLAVTGESTHWIGRFDINGSDGTIFFRNERDAYLILESNPKEKVPIQPKDDEEPWGLAYLLEDFYDAITRDRAPFTNIQNNLHSFLIIEAAKMSAHEHRIVDVERELREDWMPWD
ncbi:MAG TPA: Gfo/Idh/MocA family oxidoreductase [Candidatus Lokiarchaeia archaeon]|nr:Gfo/Idh/MocA family oxidoreductase [Candidatus Lokiarchaeia archaeon]